MSSATILPKQPHTIGQYHVKRLIADTDFSEVFEAESTSGDLVCLKRIKSHVSTAAELSVKFRREAEILAGIQHPNIVRVLEVGSQDNSSFMVLELIHGKSLKQLIDEKPLPVQSSLNAAIQILRGLNYLHSRGILHRDIKPENILVLEQGSKMEVKIVDFGLSNSNAKESEFSGTMSYISPEQAGLVNWPVEFTADLYSFGILLYEMLSGRVPFNDTNPAAVLAAHLGRTPESLVDVRPGLPPILDKVVQKLLAKKPSVRYSSGQSLLNDLERIELMIQSSDASPNFEIDTKRKSDLTLRKVFVARKDEMSRLQNLLTHAQSGKISVLLVGGRAGVGKSALLKEFESLALVSGARFAYGKCFEFSRSLPCYCLGEALEDFLRKVEVFPKVYQDAVSSNIKQAVGDLSAELVQIAPSYGRIMGKTPAAKYLGEDKDRQRFLDLMVRLLTAVSHRSAPLVLLLDDLQWADQVVLDVLERISTQAQSLPVLVIGTYRSEEVSEAHGLHRLIELARSQTSMQSLELQPFDLASINEWLSVSLGLSEADLLVETLKELPNFLFSRSGGNIFFAQEILAVLIESGAIKVKNERLDFDLRLAESTHLPENVTELVVKRLSQLGLTERTILGVGGIIGNQFSYEQMVSCIGAEGEIDVSSLESSLEACVKGNFLRRTASGEYTFYHDKINEGSRNLLDDQQKKIYRRRIINFAEANLSDDETIFELAEHCVSIQDLERTVKYCRMAGDAALVRHAKKEAARYFKSALMAAKELNQTNPVLMNELQMRLGESLVLQGQFSDARAIFDSLKDVSNLTPVFRSRVLSKIAECLQKEGSYDESRAFLVQALHVLGQKLSKEFGPLTDFRDRVRVWCFRAVPRVWLQMFVGKEHAKAAAEVYSRLWMVQLVHDMNPLLHVSRRFLAMGYVIGPGEELALALRNLSLALANQVEPRISEALKYSREVVDVARQASANDALASGMVGLAAINTWRGEYKEALLYCERSREMFISVGNFWDLGNSLIFFYFCRKALGNFDEALSHALGLIELGGRTGSNGLKASGHAKASEILFLMGKQQVSESHIESSLSLAKQHRLSFDLFQAIKAKGQMLLYSGQFQESRDTFQAAISVLEEKGGSFFKAYISEAYLGWIEATIKSGRFESEVKKIEKVLEDCRRREKSLREFGNVLRVEGILMSALGQFEKSQQSFDSAIHKFQQDERPFDLAITGLDFARSSLQRLPDVSRDRLVESRKIFAELKTPFFVEECNRLLSDLGEKIEAVNEERLSAVDLVPALNRVSLAFSKSLDPIAQSREILDTAIGVLHAERAFIFIKNSKTGHFEFQLGRDRSGSDIHEAQGYSTTLVKKVAESGKPMVIAGTNDGLIAGAHSVLVHNLLSIIASPIEVNGQVRGLVYLDNRVKERLYTDSDIEILYAMSGQIGVGFEISDLASREVSRKSIEKDLEVVGSVQNLLLPKRDQFKIGEIETAVSFQPADLSGGDWWCYEKVDENLFFLMGDVTGHGAGSAMVTAVVAGAVQILRPRLSSPHGVEELLSQVHECLVQLCGEKYNMTMTAVYFDKSKKTAAFWYAGSPGALRLDSSGECHALMMPSLPLGLRFKVECEQVTYKEGDRFLIYTDGIFEQRMADGREIGMRRIMKGFLEAGDQPAEQIRNTLREKINRLRGSEPLGDDHTFAIFRAEL